MYHLVKAVPSSKIALFMRRTQCKSDQTMTFPHLHCGSAQEKFDVSTRRFCVKSIVSSYNKLNF